MEVEFLCRCVMEFSSSTSSELFNAIIKFSVEGADNNDNKPSANQLEIVDRIVSVFCDQFRWLKQMQVLIGYHSSMLLSSVNSNNTGNGKPKPNYKI